MWATFLEIRIIDTSKYLNNEEAIDEQYAMCKIGYVPE